MVTFCADMLHEALPGLVGAVGSTSHPVAAALVVLGVTLVLLVTEALRVDVVALLVLLTVGWLDLVPGENPFAGLSSRAVVAIMAVMILGAGLERSGITKMMTRPLVNAAGGGSNRLLFIVIETRGILTSESEWLNEIHPTSKGFAKIATPIFDRMKQEFPALS